MTHQPDQMKVPELNEPDEKENIQEQDRQVFFLFEINGQCSLSVLN